MVAIAVGRLALGMTVLVAPRAVDVLVPGLRHRRDAHVFVRMLAGRDFALAVATLRAASTGASLGGLALAGALSDLADAAISLAAARATPSRFWVPSVVAGLASAAGGAVCGVLLGEWSASPR